MKKYLALAILFICSDLVHAQSEDEVVITASNKIARQTTPSQVVDSLKKRFPNANAVQYYETSPEAVRTGWAVEKEDDLSPGEDLDYYTVSFKRKDFRYYALFDQEGTLLMSKYEEHVSKVPGAVKNSVKQALGSSYKDYSVLSKNYYKKVNHEKRSEYYEVKVVNRYNKKDKKTLMVAPDGKTLKEKG